MKIVLSALLRRRAVSILALSLALWYLAVNELGAETRELPFVESVPCGLPGKPVENVECGYLYTHLDRGDPGTGTIKIPYQFIPSRSRDRQPATIVIITGGPGGMGLFDPSYAELFEDYHRVRYNAWLEKHDVLRVSQRGLPDTDPALLCEAFDDHVRSAKIRFQPLTHYLPPPDGEEFGPEYWIVHERLEARLEKIRSCVDELDANGVDYRWYNSAAIADDFSDVINALGLDHVVLWGQSYGTRIALLLIDRHPEVATAAILEGAFPPGIGTLEASATKTNGVRSRADRFLDNLGEFDEFCQKSSSCGETSPNLPEQAIENYQRLRRTPLELDISPVSMTGHRMARLDHMLYAEIIEDAMGNDRNPSILAGIMQGDELWIGFQIAWKRQSEQFVHQPTRLAVRCLDMGPDTGPPATVHSAPDNPFAEYFDNQPGLDTLCDAWWGGDPPSLARAYPVSTDIPVIMLTGEWDTASPPFLMREQLKYLRHGWAFELKGMGHGVLHDTCAHQLVRSFLRDIWAPPDSRCVDHGPMPPKN
ncbi:MAG: alpha/beta fold hydrolase [Rhodospirillales bacterium]